MSLKAMLWAFHVKCPSPTAKLVLIVLSDAHNGHTGRCHPSMRRIVEFTGLSENGVRNGIRALKEAGLISATLESADDGRTKGIRYLLNIDGKDDPHHVQENPHHVQEGVHDVHPGGFTTCTGEGSRRAPPTRAREKKEREEGTSTSTVTPNGVTSEGADKPAPLVDDPKRDLYRRGEQVLGGKDSGGVITKLIAAKGGSIAKARAAIESASEAHNPREYIGAIIRGKKEPTEEAPHGYDKDGRPKLWSDAF